MTTLPASFVPSEHHIIIGRGRVVKQHAANKRFDKMVSSMAAEYSNAPCKAEKGLILTKLINMIHDDNPEAGFVRKDPTTGVWTLVEESLARQTAAQALRNYLCHSYRSSKQFKQKRRIQQIKEEQDGGVHHRTDSGNSITNVTSFGLAAFTSSIPVSMLGSTRCVSPGSESDSSEQQDNTFDILLSVFGANVDLSDNAFEPRPLSPSLKLSNDFPLQFFSV